MNRQRLLRFTGIFFVVLLVQRSAFASCDVFDDTECSAATFSTIVEKAQDVQFHVDAFKTSLLDLGDPSVRVIFSLVNRLGAKAGEIETISKGAITNMGVGNGDIEAVAFIVLMQATNDMDNDLQEIMAEVKSMTNAKQKLRDLINLVNKDVADDYGDVVTSVTDLVEFIRCPFCD